jgi:hypothetical protein
MTAELSDVGEENIAGGFAMIERYARLAVRKKVKPKKKKKKERLLALGD